MTQWPATAPRRKSQFTMRNGKCAVTHRRLMFVIVDAYADAFPRSDFLGIIRDGGLHVSIAIDVSDHRRRGRRQRAGVDLVAQSRRKSQRDCGGGLWEHVPRSELTAFCRTRCPPTFLRDVLDERESITSMDPDHTDPRRKPCIGQAFSRIARSSCEVVLARGDVGI